MNGAFTEYVISLHKLLRKHVNMIRKRYAVYMQV